MVLPVVSLKLIGVVGPYDTGGDTGVGVTGVGVGVDVAARMITCKHVPMPRSPTLAGVSVSTKPLPACRIRCTSSGFTPAFACKRTTICRQQHKSHVSSPICHAIIAHQIRTTKSKATHRNFGFDAGKRLGLADFKDDHRSVLKFELQRHGWAIRRRAGRCIL